MNKGEEWQNIGFAREYDNGQRWMKGIEIII